MRRFAALLLVACLVFAASAYAATSVTWKTGTSKTVKIRKGGTVKWVWADSAPHDVSGPGFKSRIVSKKGFTYSHRFTRKGTFKIICIVHSNMKTIVKVS